MPRGGTKSILLAPSVDFSDGISSQRVEAAVSQLERRTKMSYPKRVFIGAGQARRHGAAARLG